MASPSSWLSGWDYPSRVQLAIGAAAAVGVGVGVARLLARRTEHTRSTDDDNPRTPDVTTVARSARNLTGPPPARQNHSGSGRFPLAKIPADPPREAEEEPGAGTAPAAPKTQQRPGKERAIARIPHSPLVPHRPPVGSAAAGPAAAAAATGTDHDPARGRTKGASAPIESTSRRPGLETVTMDGVANQAHWLAERSHMVGRIDSNGSGRIGPDSRNGLAVDAAGVRQSPLSTLCVHPHPRHKIPLFFNFFYAHREKKSSVSPWFGPFGAPPQSHQLDVCVYFYFYLGGGLDRFPALLTPLTPRERF